MLAPSRGAQRPILSVRRRPFSAGRSGIAPARRVVGCAERAGAPWRGHETVAVPYQVYQLTHSSLDVGLVSLAQLFPLIGGALLGGSVVDAMDRRRLARMLPGFRKQRTPEHPPERASRAGQGTRYWLSGVSDTSNNAQG